MFDITYQDEAGVRQHVWQTSWGVTTRLIGAVVMTHGDDQGLRLPPRIAPIQAVVVPIWKKDAERAQALEFVERVRQAAPGVRLHVDARDQYTPGWKYNEYEMRGVPVRLEVGPRDIAQGSVLSVRRDTRAKEPIPLDALARRLPELLDQVQRELLQSAKTFRDANTAPAATVEDLERHFADRRGFVALPWNDDAAVEARIKQRTGATLRCVPLDQSPFQGVAKDGRPVALFARSY